MMMSPGKSLFLLALLVPSFSFAGGDNPPKITGVWKGVPVSPDDPNWHIEDIACMFNCSSAQYNRLLELLEDPGNREKSLSELYEESLEFASNYLATLLTDEGKRQQQNYKPGDDPTVDCTPDRDGLRHQVTAPVPMEIEQQNDKVFIRYEFWNAERTVFMDGRDHPTNGEQSRLGHSIGHYEGSTLVIDTVDVIPMSVVNLPGGPLFTAPGTIFGERYTITDDGKRLVLEYSINDPVNFHTPFKGIVTYLLAPDWELGEWKCEAVTGKF